MIRAQLTIPDMVLTAAALVVLYPLAAAFYKILDANAGELGTGTAYLFQMVVPGLVVTLLVIVFAIAVGGR